MRRRLQLLLALVGAAALLATACSSGDDPDATSGTGTGPDPEVSLPDDIELTAALRPFDSCDALLEHVRAEALSQVGPYGLDGGGIAYAEGDMAAAQEGERASETTAAAAPTADGDTAGGAGGDYSTTNVQEAGVDEPDIVKSDGRRIVALARGGLHVVDVSSGSPVLQGSIDLGEVWAQDMFLSGDRVLVFSAADLFALPAASALRPIDGISRGSMQIIEVDISDPAAPRLGGRITLTGSYVSARMVGTSARIVVQEWGPALPWAYPTQPGTEAEAAEANRQLILQSTVTDWLPGYSVTAADGAIVAEGPLVACDRVHRPEAFSGLGTVTVATVDLAAGLGGGPRDAVSVFGAGDNVYASPTGLYVTTTDWAWMHPAADAAVAPDAQVRTQVHRFDISDPARTTYVASGEVPGYVLNQWALDEHAGHLRVATTTDPPWLGPDGVQDSQSMVTVLATQGEQLVPVGRVEGLGHGERIFAVRYFDDLATVVTFRQTDPLYTIDLGDPANPRLLGELKIPGYSAYLHPIGGNLVLGVGQDATEDGLTTGSQVSVFDLTDRANPRRLGTWSMPGSSSETEFDAHAFLWWDPADLAVIPLTLWGSPVPVAEGEAPPFQEPWFGAVGLRIGQDGSVTEVGRVSQQGPSAPRTDCWVEVWPADEVEAYRQSLDPEAETLEVLGPVPGDPTMVNVRHCTTYIEADYAAQIRRSAVVGDRLYTLSEKGLLSSDLATLAPAGLVEFPVFDDLGGGARPLPVEG